MVYFQKYKNKINTVNICTRKILYLNDQMQSFFKEVNSYFKNNLQIRENKNQTQN